MVFRILLYVLAGVSFLYSMVIYNVHSGSKFFLFWAALAIALAVFALLLRFRVFQKLPKGLNICLFSIVGIGVAFALVLLCLILTGYKTKPSGKVDYLLVLGAQMRPDGPSAVLKYRLDAAEGFLKENPDVICVCSGGKGENEPESEASGMAKYLMDAGIDKSRIILEEQSTNTRENIQFSRELIPEGANICIVTNNFHMYRALYLARRFGLENVQGLSADSLPLYAPNNVVREVVGMAKDLIIRKGYLN